MTALASSVENLSGCGLVAQLPHGRRSRATLKHPGGAIAEHFAEFGNVVVAILVLPSVRFRMDDYRV